MQNFGSWHSRAGSGLTSPEPNREAGEVRSWLWSCDGELTASHSFFGGGLLDLSAGKETQKGHCHLPEVSQPAGDRGKGEAPGAGEKDSDVWNE